MVRMCCLNKINTRFVIDLSAKFIVTGGYDMPSDEKNAELHKNLLAFLVEFDTFCRNNNIKYSIHGGTLLGAVREKGFIPWDDDLDVSLTRTELQKFKLAVKSSKALVFKCTNNFLKLYKYTDNGSYLWIDILVYDYISENKFIQKLKMLILAVVSAWCRTDEQMQITKAHGLYTGWKYALIKFFQLLGKPFSTAFKDNVHEKACMLFPGRKRLIHRSNDQFNDLGIILPASSMETYEFIKFEDTEFMTTNSYDLVLRTSYGDDYMTPMKIDHDVRAHSTCRQLKEKNTEK